MADAESKPTRGGGAQALPPSHAGGGLFAVYKPGQGKWTRVGTFGGAFVMVAWGAFFLLEQLSVYEGQGWGLVVSKGIPLAFLALLGIVVWWVSYLNRRSGDFMIATEGEMKKVNWSTWREIIGSTKVVIVCTILLALLLFCVDIVFQFAFTWIGVLKAAS